MRTYESWLYKNYHKPLTESDTNGVIVAFDPTRNNALLHQQVAALQERTQFDKRVIAKTDSYTTLLTIAEQAWHEGYEHLAVMTSSERLSEVDRFLQERCGSAFESIQVIPEHSPRLYEAPQQQVQQQPIPGQTDLSSIAGMDDLTGGEEEATEEDANTGKPISLIFLQLNPPVAGTKKVIQTAMQLLGRKKAPNPHFVLYDANIPRGYVFPHDLRDKLLRGDDRQNALALYGKHGVNPIADNLGIMKHPAIYIGESSIADALQSHKSLNTREVQLIAAPTNMKSLLQGVTVPIEWVTPDTDTFNAAHKGYIDLGRKIVKDSPKPKKDEDASNFSKEEFTDKDRVTLYFLNMCFLATKLSGDALTKQLSASWKMSQSAFEAWKEAGELSGIGDIIGGVKDMVGKVEVKDKAAALQKTFNELEAFEFDAMKAMHHSDYEKFQKGLDLG